MTYLVTPWGPRSRDDALTLGILESSLKIGATVGVIGIMLLRSSTESAN